MDRKRDAAGDIVISGCRSQNESDSMNLYDRIQRAIGYMEQNLSKQIDVSEAAKNAYFYRLK